jgi:hypothetical protein
VGGWGGGWRVYGASDPNQYIAAKLALLLYTSGIQATNIQCIQLSDIVLNKYTQTANWGSVYMQGEH